MIREELNLTSNRKLASNLSYLDFSVSSGESDTRVALSGEYSPPGTVPSPTSRFYTPTLMGTYVHSFDAELKLAEDFTSQFSDYIGDANFTGNLNFYSELQICESGNGVLDQLGNNFPSLNITRSWSIARVS